MKIFAEIVNGIVNLLLFWGVRVDGTLYSVWGGINRNGSVRSLVGLVQFASGDADAFVSLLQFAGGRTWAFFSFCQCADGNAIAFKTRATTQWWSFFLSSNM